MNRRSFFRFLGIGAVAAVVMPKMLVKTMEPRDGQYFIGVDSGSKGSAVWAIVKDGKIVSVNILNAGKGYKR